MVITSKEIVNFENIKYLLIYKEIKAYALYVKADNK